MAPLTDISRAFGHQISPSSEPISRTMQYRKVTKPLLERQRRARINRCLDDLKEVLISGIKETENITRLEKADILELTVRHLQKLQQEHKTLKSQEDLKFRDGFTFCAQTISKFLAANRQSIQFGSEVMVHLGNSLNQITSPSSRMTRPGSACSHFSSEGYGPYTPPASPTESQFPHSPVPLNMSSNARNNDMWRPW